MGLGVLNKLFVANRMPKPFAYYPLISDGRDVIGGRDMQLENVTFDHNGAYFNGINSKGTIPDDDIFTFADANGDKPFSISFYVIIEKSDCYYVNKVNGNIEREFFIHSFRSKKIKFGLYGNGVLSKYIQRHSSSDLIIGQMHHIVVTYNGRGSANDLNIYIDKTNVNGAVYSGNYTKIYNTPSNVGVGHFPGKNLFHKGYLKDIKFFDVELTPEQIQKL